jgi:hypothetical protein
MEFCFNNDRADYILDTELQIDRVGRTIWSITVLPLPIVPDPVRIMLDGLNLTMRIAGTFSTADMAAERAYGFVLGIETVKALPPEVIGNLYRWVDATYDEVIKGLGQG